jgi:hypothetical protein
MLVGAGAQAGPADRAAASHPQKPPRRPGRAAEAKLYRVLVHTYFQPLATQEQVAEVLDLPFSTYRRHLKAGLTRLSELLWQKEIGG